MPLYYINISTFLQVKQINKNTLNLRRIGRVEIEQKEDHNPKDIF